MSRILYPSVTDWQRLFSSTKRKQNLGPEYASCSTPLDGSHTMLLSSFLRAQTLMEDEPLRHFDVELFYYFPRDIAKHLVEIAGDTLYFEAIEHEPRDRYSKGLTSIHIKYNKIIGGELLAVVMSDTTPWRRGLPAASAETYANNNSTGGQFRLPGFEDA